jgi:MoxR-like ATPase
MTSPYTVTTPSQADEQAIAAFMEGATRLEAAVQTVILGQAGVVRETITALLAGGHVLLEGVPGLGKTLLVRTLGAALNLSFARVQFTPDLMPADITGTTILREDEHGRRTFDFQAGPLFAHLVLADEINRATPKTQSALLEAMQERTVTVGNDSHHLPAPFFVLATQNPLEQEGTYPLPEAQLDRFLLQIDVSYPDIDAERQILIATTGVGEEKPTPVMTAQELLAAQRLVRRIPVGESVVEAILAMVRAGRPETATDDTVRRHIAWGPGPRASQALMLACRARALLENRLSPSIDDVLALAGPVLRHRMALNFSARAEGMTIPQLIERLAAPLM